jgi:hypothetical protein
MACPCGRWRWRELAVSTGIGAHERTCPRCRKRRLLVVRGGVGVGVLPLPGRDPGSVRAALAGVDGISPLERAALIAAARRQQAGVAPPGDTH